MGAACGRELVPALFTPPTGAAFRSRSSCKPSGPTHHNHSTLGGRVRAGTRSTWTRRMAPAHDRPRPTGAVAGVALLFGMQPAPCLGGDGAVLVVLTAQGGGRDRPGGRVGAVELGPVAARPARAAGWPWWRVGVKAAIGSQPHQHRHGDLGKVQGQLGRLVAAVEHRPWHRPAGRQPLQEPPARADRPRHPHQRAAGGRRPDHRAGPSLALASTLPTRLLGHTPSAARPATWVY